MFLKQAVGTLPIAIGADIATSTPQQFADFIKTEHAKWGQRIKESETKVE
jgi:hypothetical protein